MSEKTEQATAYKLQKAKEKGQVSKSTELTVYISLLLTSGLISLLWPKQLKELEALCSSLLSMAAHFSFTVDTMQHLHHLLVTTVLGLWFPVALTALLGIILGSMSQTGLVWSPTALNPDFKRINPAHGFKKLYSMNTLFETLKSSVKLSSAPILIYCLLKKQIPPMMQTALTHQTPNPALLMHFLLGISAELLLLLVLLALIDKRYTRWKFNKEQKMSKQEVKEEYRQREGDPKIKQKIKQVHMQLRQKTAALKQLKNADVIITNPTHLAIALKYERGSMPAPKVIYKAQDKLVSQVKDIAKRHNIPIMEHKVLARMLHHSIELNQYISKDLFPLVAQVFKELYQRQRGTQ